VQHQVNMGSLSRRTGGLSRADRIFWS